jgi:peroxiredoxin
MRLIQGLLFGLLVCAAVVNSRAAGPDARNVKLKIGDKAPDFALRDQRGALVRLSDFTGCHNRSLNNRKYVLLDFFATDCKACREELPQVVEIAKKHSDKMQVLLVALLEKEDGQNKLDEFLRSNSLTFPVLADTYSAAAKKYVANGDMVTIPALFLIDCHGSVREILLGVQGNLELAVAKILTPEPVSN